VSELRLSRLIVGSVLTIACFVGIDGILVSIGNSNPSLLQSPEVWGNYGEWAMAIFPPAGLLYGVLMWRQDRREADKVFRAMLGSTVYLNVKDARSVLTNASPHQIYYVREQGGELYCLPAGGSSPFELVTAHVDFITVRGEHWRAVKGSPSERAD
jgi:hypothetical protein